jgi:ankyrin repeat protein
VLTYYSFLLAKLHLNSLKGKRSPKAIRTALNKLSTGSGAYNSAYESAMERIEAQLPDEKELAKQALLWITCAKRPLNTTELEHALAVEIGQSQFDKENVCTVEGIVSVCAGLVTIDDESNIIRLVHYTTQEYFERTQSNWFPNAETEITAICVTYLSFDVFESEFCQTDESKLQLYPLYGYAAQNWGHHARASAPIPSEGVGKLILDFLESSAKVSASSQVLMAPRSKSEYTSGEPVQMTGGHLAAYFGLRDTMINLLKGGLDPDVRNNCRRTPLSFAAENGYEAVVKLLLNAGTVNPDIRASGAYDEPYRERTPLSLAAGNGHETYYKHKGRTPLSFAAENGHLSIVELLLATGEVEPDSKCTGDGEDFKGRTPLAFAAANGHEAVVKLLLATGKVDPDSYSLEGGSRMTPLSTAAVLGQEAVAKLLLSTGQVEPDSYDIDGKTPLAYAAENGQEAIVKLLLATDKVDPDSECSWDGLYLDMTPLLWAAVEGHTSIVKLLLANNKVNPNSEGCYYMGASGRTAVSLAAEHGHEEIIKLLIATDGVDLDIKDIRGLTPLSWAARGGHEAVVKSLLATKKVDPDTRDNNGRSPLSLAVQEGHEAVVQLLLATKKVDPKIEDGNGRTLLSRAAENGHRSLVRLLLDIYGANPDLKDNEGRTPLWWAIRNSHEAVIRQLLAKYDKDLGSRITDHCQVPILCTALTRLLEVDGVDPDLKDNNGRTLLSHAAEKGLDEVVKLLLATGRVDPNSHGSWEIYKRITPHRCALTHGHEVILRTVGATNFWDPDSEDNQEDNHGRTPLWWAAEKGHGGVVKLLLDMDGVDPDFKDNSGQTPLSIAAKRGHEAVVKLLLTTNGVDPNSTCCGDYPEGATPLWHAAMWGKEAVVKLLLSADGINPDRKCQTGHYGGVTPFSTAVKRGHVEVAKLLLITDGVDLNSKDFGGRTPLSHAARKGHEALVELLLSTNRVDVDYKDKYGRTPYWHAVKGGHTIVAKLLKGYIPGAYKRARDLSLIKSGSAKRLRSS